MSELSIINKDNIVDNIHFVRGVNIMPDQDLAMLYGVQTRVLKQAVRRNIKRFPVDFMFELTRAEVQSLRSQVVTLKRGQHSKYLPFAFTEQGVAMLSSVLTSDRAISVNIEIMRAFIHFRSMAFNMQKLERKIDALEEEHDKKFAIVFEALQLLIRQENEPRKRIGFKTSKDETGNG